MSGYTVIFEEIEPWAKLGISCPLTFRVSGTYWGKRKWNIDEIEVPAPFAIGKPMGWVTLNPTETKTRELRAILMDYATSDEGYEAIEQEIEDCLIDEKYESRLQEQRDARIDFPEAAE